MPLVIQIAALFAAGALLGSLANWAIYTLAWHPRPISPWSPAPTGSLPRRWTDRLPIVGWLSLKREAEFHGHWFWLRPMMLELCTGIAVAGLYWWEIDRLGLIRVQFPAPLAPPLVTLHFQFVSHLLLLWLMLSASFIDIDEKIIPDEITVPGTVLGLALATLVPTSLLPHVAQRAAQPVVGVEVSAGVWLEPMTAAAPRPWPPAWGAAGDWPALAIGLACYWLWCFALAPRIWRGSRGRVFALRLILARINRELSRPPLRRLLFWGTAVVVFVWALRAQAAWAGMLTALIGLAVSGGIVWAVRLIGTAALKREAMGFGDVTLMMMIGTFLGWQASLIVFFLAPFAGLLVGLLQFVLRRGDVIPYGPFLCLGAAVVVVAWAPIWNWAQPLFGLGTLVPAVLVVCLVLLGVILTLWQMIKSALFGRVA